MARERKYLMGYKKYYLCWQMEGFITGEGEWGGGLMWDNKYNTKLIIINNNKLIPS